MKLNVKDLTDGLQFHGEVTGKRQTYFILSTKRRYLVMSESRSKRASGYFNLVSRPAVEALHRRLRGQKDVTAKQVFTRSRTRRTIPSSLTALNMLYVLVATGRATIDRRRHSPELHFNVKG
jgi:hypothetical protein